MSKRGLPGNFKLRHDAHYVEILTSRNLGAPVGRMVPLDRLAPNPSQPRVDLGDLTELVASIKEKGVLEPLLIRPSEVGGRYMIISGERRYRASIEAGLAEVPCIEMDVDDSVVAEICLIENLQRKDLTPFEEADGLQALVERFQYTHGEIAKKLGKARSSITESLSLAAMPSEVRELCRRADITSKSTLLQIIRQPTLENMMSFVEEIAAGRLTRDQARDRRSGKDKKPTGYLYRYTSLDKSFSLTLRFKRSKVAKDDIADALSGVIDEIKS